MTILVRMPNWLGDAVMALPALAGVREASAGARVVAVTTPALAPVLEGAADRVLVLGRGRSSKEPIAGEQAETGVLFTASFSSAFLFRIAGVRTLVGYRSEGRALLGVRGPAKPRRVHLAEQYARLVDEIGSWSRDLRPRLPGAARWSEAMAPRLGEFGLNGKRRAVIFPGAAYGPAKRWPLSRFILVARALRENDVSVCVAGTRAERPLAEELARAAGLPESAVIAGRTDLPELGGILAHADLALANDSGALHFASACGASSVGVFGSTDPSWTAPFSGRVLYHPTPCSPCFRRTCDIGYRCLSNVEAIEVVAACRRALEGKEG